MALLLQSINETLLIFCGRYNKLSQIAVFKQQKFLSPLSYRPEDLNSLIGPNQDVASTTTP